MCTAITFENETSYLGRNMDIGCSFGERVVIVPGNFELQYKKEIKENQHYAMIGMASVFAGAPLFAEAINEKGLGVMTNNPTFDYISANIRTE